jgi:acetolactate synthase-1/2/3 large subunit
MGGIRFRSDPYIERLKEHDVIFAVGTRMAYPNLLSGQQVLQLDIDSKEIGRNYENTIGIVGDAKRTLEVMGSQLSTATPARASRKDEFEAMKADRFDLAKQPEPLASYMQAIRAGTPEDGIIISGMTQLGYYSRSYCDIYEPGTYITSSYFGNLGYAYPTALGAKVAKPDKAVVAISGDGGFMFNSQELATAVRYGINAVVIVFNDNAYGNVLRDQKTGFSGRAYGSELHNPDFMKLADAYGARGVRVDGSENLEKALKESVKIEAPTLIEVPVGEMPYPF